MQIKMYKANLFKQIINVIIRVLWILIATFVIVHLVGVLLNILIPGALSFIDYCSEK